MNRIINIVDWNTGHLIRTVTEQPIKVTTIAVDATGKVRDTSVYIHDGPVPELEFEELLDSSVIKR